MCFSILVNPKPLGLTAISSATPDIKITSEIGIPKTAYSKFSSIKGIKRIFGKTTRNSDYSSIEIQLKNDKDENIVKIIQSKMDSTMTFHDLRELNSEAKNAFLTAAIFIYSFVGVIALISMLNIINTMNTSVDSKQKYLGVMRAIGMSGDQVLHMVLTQALVYSLSGCTLGCILGTLLQRTLSNILLPGDWKFPLSQIVFIFICYGFVSIASVINPLKRIRASAISEVVTSL